VLRQAVGRRVSALAFDQILAANLGQDTPLGLLRPEFHFDNALGPGLAYIERCRRQAAAADDPAAARAAFGRLSHAAQDFYSHSNYVHLWRARYPDDAPPPDAIPGLDPELLAHPALTTARVYWIDALWFVRRLRPWVLRHAPPDSHARTNLDSPAAGALFPYSLAAAAQRTAAEFDLTLTAIVQARGQAAANAFCGLAS
jgi:hypothetical protein